MTKPLLDPIAEYERRLAKALAIELLEENERMALAPPPAFLAAIAEICEWHSRTQMLHPMRTLPSGRREPILPPEIPDAIRRGEIEVPESLMNNILEAAFGPRTLANLPPDFGSGT